MKTALLKLIRRSPGPDEERFRRRVYVFLICLAISSIFWLLISLNKIYTSTVFFPVHYTGIPNNKVVVNRLPEMLEMEISARGFDLLTYRFRMRPDPITINVKSGLQYSTLTNAGNPVIPTRSLLNEIIRQLGTDIHLISVSPDKINLTLSEKKTKNVRVKPRIQLHFQKQYDLIDSVQIHPSVVLASGPASNIDKIRFAETERVTFNSLHQTITKEIRLKTNPEDNILFSPETVTLTIPVDEYTEANAEVMIEKINTPSRGTVKLIPRKASVTYQVALSKYSLVTEGMFVVTADLSKKQGNKVPLVIKKSPSFVKSVKVNPLKADLIITK